MALHQAGRVKELIGPAAPGVETEIVAMGQAGTDRCDPIAGHASATTDGRLSLFGMVFSRDGSEFVRAHAHGVRGYPHTQVPRAGVEPATPEGREV